MYSGSLTSYLTKPILEKSINSLQDLIDATRRGFVPAVQPTTNQEGLFKVSPWFVFVFSFFETTDALMIHLYLSGPFIPGQLVMGFQQDSSKKNKVSIILDFFLVAVLVMFEFQTIKYI